MDSSRTITVSGLDLAAVNSGYCRVEARANSGAWPPVEITVLEHQPIELKRKDFVGRAELAVETAALAAGSDLVAIEDYVRRVGKTNTTAYECGEYVGAVKHLVHRQGLDILLVPTTTMRSMLKVPTGKDGKKFIMRWVEESFGFKPPYGREKQRSDVADAFVHAYIAAVYRFLREGVLTMGDLNEREHRTFYGNPDPRKAHFYLGILEKPDIHIKGEIENGKPKEEGDWPEHVA